MTTRTDDHRNDGSRNDGGSAWLLVTRREVLSRITDKGFLIGTAVTVLLIAGYLGFIAWQSEKTDDYDLAATPDAVEMAQAVRSAAPGIDDKVEVKVVEVADDAAAEAALTDDEVDAWLHPVDGGWQLTTESSAKDSLTAVVDEVARTSVLADNAARAGTTVEALQAGTEVTTAFLRGDAERAAVADVVGFAFVFLFYFAALVFGMQLANSVIEEKQSRIVEIIAAAIPVRHLLAGKILGNTILAMLQVLLFVGVGLGGMAFTPYKDYVPAISGPVGWFVLFFLAGFVALACLWAVAGSLASRT